MDEIKYNELKLIDKINYVNNLLTKNQTLTEITKSLSVARSTLGRNFKKADYVYNSTNKQFVKLTLSQEVKKDHSTNNGKKNVDHKVDYIEVKKLDNRPVNKLNFNIPIKTKTKTTKAFNVVMDKNLVEQIDKLAKLKGGYSRNQIINMMCEYSLDNM